MRWCRVPVTVRNDWQKSCQIIFAACRLRKERRTLLPNCSDDGVAAVERAAAAPAFPKEERHPHRRRTKQICSRHTLLPEDAAGAKSAPLSARFGSYGTPTADTTVAGTKVSKNGAQEGSVLAERRRKVFQATWCVSSQSFLMFVVQKDYAIESPRIIAPEVMQGKRIFTIPSFSSFFFVSNPCFFIEIHQNAPKMVQWLVVYSPIS